MTPYKLTPERHAKLLQLVRSGATRESACAAVRISSRTLREWLSAAQGEDASGELQAFADEFHEAESAAELRLSLTIQQAAKEDWRAAAWFMERRYRRDWAFTAKHEVSGPDGAPLIPDDAKLSLTLKLDELRQRIAGGEPGGDAGAATAPAGPAPSEPE